MKGDQKTAPVKLPRTLDTRAATARQNAEPMDAWMDGLCDRAGLNCCHP
jgi:hypothetical protein